MQGYTVDLLRPIDTLDLEYLLANLATYEQEILKLIDEDPHLKKRENPNSGLIIANSAATLFEPELEHQLYAKGIVYVREPEYKLVSIPLVKMFNHTLRGHSDATSQKFEQQPDIRFVFPEKLDGTMIQLFAHQGKSYLTTRSILEGSELKEETEYVGLARQMLERLYPELAAGKHLDGLSLTFEMIHPKTKQVTLYGAEQRLVLLAIYDHERHAYLSNTLIQEWGKAHGVEVAQPVIQDDVFERGVDRLRELLELDPSVPEGSIVCFERGDVVVHRVKVKTQEYLRQFAMRYKISFKSVVNQLWNQPELHDWDAFLDHLIAESMSEEEVEAFYREHFDAFHVWYEEVKAEHARVHRIHDEWVAEHGSPPENGEASAAWFKSFALWVREHHPDRLGQVMMLARRGAFTLENMIWQMPAYPGFRHELSLAGVRG